MSLPIPLMLLGCFQQPIANFATWKKRGCNYVVGPELGVPEIISSKDWCKAAADNGLSVVGNKFLLRDKHRPPNLIGWYLDDEPNETNHNTPIEKVEQQAAGFKAIDNTCPIWLNLGGDKLTGPPSPADMPIYLRYAKLADRLSYDWYVKNREFGRYPTYFNGASLRFLSSIGARSLGAMAECSWQRLNNSSPVGRCPTSDEFEIAVMNMVCNGATAITYFSTSVPMGFPQGYDPTPPDVAKRMTMLNAKLSGWASGIMPDAVTSQRLLTVSLGDRVLFEQKV